MNKHDQEIDAYIEDLRCALNEHGVERMEDLPESVLARFEERGLALGMLTTEEED